MRDFIARGAVSADTRVWTEGMSVWQRVGDIPDFLSGGMAASRMPPGSAHEGETPTGSDSYAGVSLSADFSI